MVHEVYQSYINCSLPLLYLHAPHCTCCRSSRILFAAFLLSLSQAEAKILSATAEVRCEGMGRDYEEKQKKIIRIVTQLTVLARTQHMWEGPFTEIYINRK